MVTPDKRARSVAQTYSDDATCDPVLSELIEHEIRAAETAAESRGAATERERWRAAVRELVATMPRCAKVWDTHLSVINWKSCRNVAVYGPPDSGPVYCADHAVVELVRPFAYVPALRALIAMLDESEGPK